MSRRNCVVYFLRFQGRPLNVFSVTRGKPCIEYFIECSQNVQFPHQRGRTRKNTRYNKKISSKSSLAARSVLSALPTVISQTVLKFKLNYVLFGFLLASLTAFLISHLFN
jgi:hypothetical protein